MSDAESRARVKRVVEAVLDRQALAKFEPYMVIGCDVGSVVDPCPLAAETAVKCLGCGKVVGLMCIGHQTVLERMGRTLVHSCGARGTFADIVELVPLEGWF